MSPKRDVLVYSSEKGRICVHCGRAVARCACRANPHAGRTPVGDGIVRVGRATRGRRGKAVTTVSGVPLPSEELRKLAQELKRRCGTGGTVKDDIIEIQGDQRDTLMAELEQRGFRVKRSGG